MMLMDGTPVGTRHESDVLLRQLDRHVAGMRHGRAAPEVHPAEVQLAERVAAALRRLVAETAQASAADRARVRAAVHYFVLRREGRGERRPVRPVTEDAWVVNHIMGTLGRHDLIVSPTHEPA
jgi:hypothetical protein